MLANAYLPGIIAIFGAAASLVLAIVLEVPILKLIWRRPLLRLASWVLLANVVSAGVGMVPIFNDAGPGMTADPWESNQHWLRTYAIHVGLLFTLTLITEGTVYHLLNRRATHRIPMFKLLAGLLVSNVASYAVLAGLMLWNIWPDRAVQVLPDTAWLRPCEERIWFVEPGSHHLCSIRLDGTDRRTEIAEPLGRFDRGYYDISLYAVMPELSKVLFISPDHEWHLAEPGGTRSVGTKLDPDDRSIVQDSLSDALEAVRTPQNAIDSAVWSNTTGRRVSHSGSMGDAAYGYRVRTIIAGGGGSGFGLSVEGPDKNMNVKIPAGPAYLACSEPAILPDRKLVVFRCSAWIMVMDVETGRVGRLVQGDSIVAFAPAFAWGAE